MRVDKALKDFVKRYDEEAINSIETISKDFALNVSKNKIKSFNIKGGFNDFSNFLTGYSSYKIENINNKDASPTNAILEKGKTFIQSELFKNDETSYAEIPLFIESYISGIQTISELTDNIKAQMIEAEVDQESIGAINEFIDEFVDVLHDSFYPQMNKFLWASGYYSRKKLFDKNRKTKPIFI